MAEERRNVAEERRYAVITKDSIKMMAESAGHADISDTISGILGEDVSYRLREITQKSSQFMRHAKRKRMNTDDFNKACKHSDIQHVHGHGSMEPPSPFRQTREGDIHFVEDPDTNLATVAYNGYMPKQLGDTTIKAHWLVVEGIQKTSQNPQGTPVNTKPEVTATLMKYFDKITQAILGSDSEMMKTALSDIRSNRNISSLLPHFISFVSNGVKTMNSNIKQLTKLLHTVHSLVCNNTLFLEPQPYLPLLIQSVEYCLLEAFTPTVYPTCDQWTLRDYAARLLAYIVSIWGNTVNHLERFTEKTLREVLYDHSKPFCCHYGAVMGLLFLGSENIERVLLPHLSIYWPHLSSSMEYRGPKSNIVQTDAHKVHGAILLSVEYCLKIYLKDFKDSHLLEDVSKSVENSGPRTSCVSEKPVKQSNAGGYISMFDKSPSAFYSEMSEYFGDSLAMRLPELLELKSSVFKPTPKEVNVSLSDVEASKSGEQLLEELMEQVRQQQEINRKQKERERYIQEKQMRENQEKLEKKRLEYERRMVDHRQQLQLAYQKKHQQAFVDSDDEIDVEGDNDNNTVANPYQPAGVSLAVKSSIGAPGQGIKMTFTKRPRLTLNLAQLCDSPQSDTADSREKETKQSRKRKQSSRSPKEPNLFEFEDISDYEAAPSSSHAHLSLYSSEGEGSSDGGSGRKCLTMKFKKKDNISD